ETNNISSDDHRQVIAWVRIKDGQGNVTVYLDRNRPPTSEQLARAERRRMDCIGCHNRPAHTFLPPDVAVDQSFAAGRLDASLPYFKREAIAVLSKPYNSTDEALTSISSGLDQFYRANYADAYSNKNESLRSGIKEI